MAGETILEETISTIEAILGDDLAGATIERVVIGLFFTGVKLTSGHVGTCATPAKSIPEAVCCPSSALAMPFPGKMRGRPALDLVKETSSDHPIRRAVGIAALNALAAQCHALRPDPRVIAEIGVDAFDAANIRDGELTVVVGAFVPFLRELRRRGQSYLVLERDPSTLKQEEMACYRPASEMRNVVPQADVLLVTGTTLINDTLEDILVGRCASLPEGGGWTDCRPCAGRFLATWVQHSGRHACHRAGRVPGYPCRGRFRLSLLRQVGAEIRSARVKPQGRAYQRLAMSL
ncbi:MAG: DUF4213 domain-containing proteins [Rhodoblastus sp.]